MKRFRNKSKALGMASAGSSAARAAAKSRLYDKQASALVTMLSERGTDTCVGSLDRVMKQLQTQDRFAFSQMLEKVMTGAMKIKNTATIASIDREHGGAAGEQTAGMTKAEERAQEEWTSVMKWAKSRALENSGSEATPHVLMYRAPDEVTATRLESMALAAFKGRVGEVRRDAHSSKYWDALFKGSAGLLTFEHENIATEVMGRLRTKLDSSGEAMKRVVVEYASSELIFTGRDMDMENLQEHQKAFECAATEMLRLSHDRTTAMMYFETVAAAVEAFAELEARLPQGAHKVIFAKVGEAVVFLDDDARLDKVVDEAEMDAAAIEEGKQTEERQLARIVRKSYEQMDALPSSDESEEEEEEEEEREEEPVEEEPFDPEKFAELERLRQDAAARVIQRAWRAYMARKLLKLARLREEEERKRAIQRAAAIQMQRRRRGVLGRRRVRDLWRQRTEREKLARAAVYVQRIGRGMLARRLADKIREQNRMTGMHAAATEIQRFGRGMLSRRAWAKMLEEERLRQAELDRRNRAATAIQRMTRGWLVRRRACEQLPEPEPELEPQPVVKQGDEMWFEDPLVSLPIRFAPDDANSMGGATETTIQSWLGNHSLVGVEPPSWSSCGAVDSQIGGRDMRRDMPLKPKWLLAADKGHKRNQTSSERKGWVALRVASPTLMLLLYMPETDSVQVLYVSGRREQVVHDVEWSELEAKLRVQDGRTLPNSKRTMHALYRKAHGKCKSAQYLLSVDSGQWHELKKVRDATQEGLLNRLSSERSSNWSIGMGSSEDKRASSGLIGFGQSGFLSTISRESFPASRGSRGSLHMWNTQSSIGLGGPQASQTTSDACCRSVPPVTAGLSARSDNESENAEDSMRRNHNALHPTIGLAGIRDTGTSASTDLGSIIGEVSRESIGTTGAACIGTTGAACIAEERSAVVLAALAEGKWSEVLGMVGVPDHQVRAIERTANAHWQKRKKGQAPTVGAPEPGEMFSTPTPPPPCRSGQDDVQQRRVRTALMISHRQEAIRFRSERNVLMRQFRTADGRRHDYVQPFTSSERGGSDRSTPTAVQSIFERSLGSVYSARHKTTVPTLHAPVDSSAFASVRLQGATSHLPASSNNKQRPVTSDGSTPLRSLRPARPPPSGHYYTERAATAPTAPRRLADLQRYKDPVPPAVSCLARPLTSSGAGESRGEALATARPSTVGSVSQDSLGGSSSATAIDTLPAPAPQQRALNFLVSVAGKSKFNLEVFDATGPDQRYIVPSYEDLRAGSLIALPSKLRLKPHRFGHAGAQ